MPKADLQTPAINGARDERPQGADLMALLDTLPMLEVVRLVRIKHPTQ